MTEPKHSIRNAKWITLQYHSVVVLRWIKCTFAINTAPYCIIPQKVCLSFIVQILHNTSNKCKKMPRVNHKENENQVKYLLYEECVLCLILLLTIMKMTNHNLLKVLHVCLHVIYFTLIFCQIVIELHRLDSYTFLICNF